ncbi:hypothetical protein P7C73_g2844, partial [Tremellales sp. Uapishka_1]
MTTNRNAVAGPSTLSLAPMTVPGSITGNAPPSLSGSENGDSSGPSNGVQKPGLSVDENGEVVKVPAFLNKLYSMVSDDSTDELIHWADSGDSFFVPNHERFGKELLPRFFKHANFSSFVRQLNMYGFHKVPHLQSGVLKNDTPSELWEFVNPFFKRSHPNLLAKVTRKNNRPGQPPPVQSTSQQSNGTRASSRQAAAAAANQYLITDGTVDGEIGSLVGPTPGQMIDLSAITSGIAAIRQTQANIGADLKALQSSNEMLWREALDGRERHRNHQETIDLIVSFLERLFGKEGEGVNGLKEALRGKNARARDESGGEEGMKKKRKLGLDRMIGDGRVGGAGDVIDDDKIWEGEDDLVEISSDANPYNFTLPPRLNRGKSRQGVAPQPALEDSWPSSNGQRFTTLPSTDEESSPYGSSASNRYTPGQEQTLHQGDFSPLSEPGQLNPSAGNVVASYGTNYPQPPPLSPKSTAAAAQAFNLDPAILQTTIGSLLQSPAAANMFLNSLKASSQGQQALQTPTKASFSDASTYPFPNGNENGNHGLDLYSTGLPALAESSDQLLKSYGDANAVGGDVEKLQESIDSLVRSMGLDLPNGDAGMNGHMNNNGNGDGNGGLGDDFNVDEFLEQLGKDQAVDGMGTL